MKSNQKGFAHITAIILAVVIVIVAAGGYIVYSKNQNSDPEPVAETAQPAAENAVAKTDNPSNLKTTEHNFVYSNTPGYIVALTHPEAWKAETFSGQTADDNPRNFIKLTSPEGYVVYLNDGDGIGYNCESDLRGEVTYTLKDRIKTKTDQLDYVLVKTSKYATATVDGKSVVVESDTIYIPQDPTNTDASKTSYGSYAFNNMKVNDTKVINYTDDQYGCTPLMGPKPGFEYINIIVKGPGEKLSTFASGIEEAVLQNEDVRAVVASIKIDKM